jgi:hypothetical protein
MTYLNLVNNVLRRLREDEVSSVQSTTYSKLAGDFVNDAKKIVEDAWDWSALRTTLTVTTSSGIFNYVLTGSQNKIKVLDVINDTSNIFMQYQTQHWFNDKYLNQSPPSGAPEYYTYNGVNSSGDTQVDLYPKPDDTYTIRFNCILRGDIKDANGNIIYAGELVNDTDQLAIPAQPVIHLAVALLARERGETGGTSAPEYFGIADKYLSDAIALDAQKHPEETIWYTP